MKKNNNKTSLMAEILPLAKEIQRLRKQAEEWELFTDDRELLECGCGLIENVACGGRLFTCRNGEPADKDTDRKSTRLNSSHRT